MKADRQKAQKAKADPSMGYRALQNPRYEAFAQARAEGLPAYRAWLQAGFKGSTKVAMSASSRLLRNVQVRNRLREIVEQLADTMIITKSDPSRRLSRPLAPRGVDDQVTGQEKCGYRHDQPSGIFLEHR